MYILDIPKSFKTLIVMKDNLASSSVLTSGNNITLLISGITKTENVMMVVYARVGG